MTHDEAIKKAREALKEIESGAGRREDVSGIIPTMAIIARRGVAALDSLAVEPKAGHGSDCDCDSCRDIDGFSPAGLAASLRELAVEPSEDADEIAWNIEGLFHKREHYTDDHEKIKSIITARDERIRRECGIDNDILFGDIWERLCPAGWNKADWVWECQNIRRGLTDGPRTAITKKEPL